KKSGSPISETIQNFPSAIVNFSRTPEASVFNGTEEDTWDKNLRERGYILFDEGLYKMWYTGYNESISPKKFLGLAISKDGINWERYSDKPLLPETWIEDMYVVKYNHKF